jgi:hypothetical protein
MKRRPSLAILVIPLSGVPIHRANISSAMHMKIRATLEILGASMHLKAHRIEIQRGRQLLGVCRATCATMVRILVLTWIVAEILVLVTIESSRVTIISEASRTVYAFDEPP